MIIKNLYIMISSRAQFQMILKHLFLKFSQWNKFVFKKDKEKFQVIMNENLDIDHDWFTGKIPTWLRAFKKKILNRIKRLDA